MVLGFPVSDLLNPCPIRGEVLIFFPVSLRLRASAVTFRLFQINRSRAITGSPDLFLPPPGHFFNFVANKDTSPALIYLTDRGKSAKILK
jgi:hypothetical protein